MPKIVIVGAGVSGLSVAYRLQERLPDADITVLERDSRPGGAAWTVSENGFQIEIGPNGFLDTKPTTLDLCRTVGLSNQLVHASEAAAKNRYLFLGDRLRPLPGGLSGLVTTDLLSWRGKFDLMLERFRRRPPPRGDESIAAFARRRGGREAAAVLADALVTGIFAGDPEVLSLPACFPRLAALERDYGSILRGLAESAKKRRAEAEAAGKTSQRPGNLWSLRDGLGRLSQAVAETLKKPPQYGVAVRDIRLRNEAPRCTVFAEGKDSWPADAVILACPAYQQSQIVADTDFELAERVGQIAYNRIAVIALGFRRADVPASLDGFGFIAPQRLRRDLLGVQWCSSIYPGRAPDGAVLLRAMCGGWQRPEVVGWSDERLLEAIRAELRLAMQITAAPIYHKIIRWERAIPQYHVGHLDRVAWIENRLARHPGLFLAGNAYHGVALNDCTEQGKIVAERVASYLTGWSGDGVTG